MEKPVGNNYGSGRLLLRHDVTSEPWWKSLRARALWLELALHGRWEDSPTLPRGSCLTFHKTLAYNLGCCRRTIIRAMKELTAAGEVRTRTIGPKGIGGTIVYLKSYHRFCTVGVGDGPALYLDRSRLAGLPGWRSIGGRAVLMTLAFNSHKGLVLATRAHSGEAPPLSPGSWVGTMSELSHLSQVPMRDLLRSCREVGVMRQGRSGKKPERLTLPNATAFGVTLDAPVTRSEVVTDPTPVTRSVTQYKEDKGTTELRRERSMRSREESVSSYDYVHSTTSSTTCPAGSPEPAPGTTDDVLELGEVDERYWSLHHTPEPAPEPLFSDPGTSAASLARMEAEVARRYAHNLAESARFAERYERKRRALYGR